MEYLDISWSQVDRYTNQLRQKIAQVGDTFDAIVFVPRGGGVLATILAYDLGLPIIVPTLAVDRNKRYLWVDDIFDTGETYRSAQISDKDLFVTLVARQGTNIPDDVLYGETIQSDAWVLFPWAPNDTSR